MFYLMDPSQISAILSHLESFLPALFFLIFSRSFQAELRGEETNHRVSSLLCTAFLVTSLAKNEKWGLILLYLRDIKKNTLGVRLLAYHRNEQSTSPLLDSSHQNGCRYLLIETSQENFTPQLRGIVASPQSSTTSTTRPPALVFRLRIVPSQSLMVFRNFTAISMVRSKFTLHITSYTTCQSYIRCYFFFRFVHFTMFLS